MAGSPVELNRQGQAQVRLEGIDTLELDFAGRHQPLKYAREALDFLLSHLGIRGNLFGPAHARDGAAGSILVRRVDRHGRPVALVFRGDLEGPEGKEVYPDSNLLQKSINYQLLREGLAYPAYDSGLEPRLREELTRACQAARSSHKGFWPRDRTNLGVALDGGPGQLSKYIILPRLFRHLVRFMKESDDLRGFRAYLEDHPDPVLHLPTGRDTDLAALVEMQDNFLKLTAAPEDLVFAEI
ncbi:MAG: thermonuclease family protein [Desulfobaccales bacterium]